MTPAHQRTQSPSVLHPLLLFVFLSLRGTSRSHPSCPGESSPRYRPARGGVTPVCRLRRAARRREYAPSGHRRRCRGLYSGWAPLSAHAQSRDVAFAAPGVSGSVTDSAPQGHRETANHRQGCVTSLDPCRGLPAPGTLPPPRGGTERGRTGRADVWVGSAPYKGRNRAGLEREVVPEAVEQASACSSFQQNALFTIRVN